MNIPGPAILLPTDTAVGGPLKRLSVYLPDPTVCGFLRRLCKEGWCRLPLVSKERDSVRQTDEFIYRFVSGKINTGEKHKDDT